MIYFDNNATTRMNDNVLDEMTMIMRRPINASSIHSLGREGRKIVEESRAKIASTLGVPKNFRIIFTSSATEANNTIINSAKVSGARVMVSNVEHPSINKLKVDGEVPVNQHGEIEELTEQGFYSIILANNETGVIQDSKKLVAAARATGSLIHFDAVQAMGKMHFNCSDIGADAYTISGHKFGGPQGVGCLIYNPDVIKLSPLVIGGGQEYGLRAGTENLAAIHGISIAVEEVENRVSAMQTETSYIRRHIEKSLMEISSESVIFGYGAQNRLPNTISVTMPGVRSEVQVAYFDAHNIAVSAGSACSAGRVEPPHVQMAMGSGYDEASCALRISLGIENTMDEADYFIQKWQQLYNRNRRNGNK